MTPYRGPTVGDAMPTLDVRVELRFAWYQTVWSLATHYANRVQGRDAESLRAKGRAYAVALAQNAYATLFALDGGVNREPSVARRLRVFLRDTIEPSAIALTAGLSKATSGTVEHRGVLSDSELLRRMKLDDPSGWSAARLMLERYVLPYTWSPRTHYNLACYLASDPRERKNAIEQLAKAFDPDRSMPAELYLLADWAWEDRSLADLWGEPEFERLTAPYRRSTEIDRWLEEQRR